MPCSRGERRQRHQREQGRGKRGRGRDAPEADGSGSLHDEERHDGEQEEREASAPRITLRGGRDSGDTDRGGEQQQALEPVAGPWL